MLHIFSKVKHNNMRWKRRGKKSKFVLKRNDGRTFPTVESYGRMKYIFGKKRNVEILEDSYGQSLYIFLENKSYMFIMAFSWHPVTCSRRAAPENKSGLYQIQLPKQVSPTPTYALKIVLSLDIIHPFKANIQGGT